MRSALFALFAGLLFLSCASDQHKIDLFNGLTFQLKEGEKVVPINYDSEQKYQSYFKSESTIQIPVFKCIKSEDYEVFIGLPFNTSLSQLAVDSTMYTMGEPLLSTNTGQCIFRRFHRDGEYITVYAEKFSQNLVYVITSSNSRVASQSLLGQQAIADRFSQ